MNPYPLTVVELIERACEKYAARPAFGNFGCYVNFAEVAAYTNALAAYLQQRLCLRENERVAIMMPNCLQYPIAVLGVLKAGGIVVNINPLYTGRELRIQLTDSGARIIIVLDKFATNACDVLAGTAVDTIVTTSISDLFPWPRARVFAWANYRRFGRRAPIPAETVALKSALRGAGQLNFSPPRRTATDLAFLQYTGGTTGTPKGAMLSNRNVVSQVTQIVDFFGDTPKPGEEIVITALPLYHIFALTVNCLSFASIGGLNYFITNPRDSDYFVRELKRVRPTCITGVNTLYATLLSHDDFGEIDFSNLRFAGGGGTAIQRAVAEAWHAATGHWIAEGYGLTESSGAACINKPEQNGFTGTIGQTLSDTDYVIVDDNGEPVDLGERGEIWLRGPQIMQGYWQKPAETAATLTTDGWLKTGDIGVAQANGSIKIVDRKKDMILVSGFNVFPNEIEEVVAQLNGIAEVAAIGIPDQKSGEAVVLCIVVSDDSLSEDMVLQHCRAHLAAYKIPQIVKIVDSLPKSNVGKILRREVRTQVLGELTAGEEASRKSA